MMTRRLMMLVLLLIVLALPGLAQETTPEPTVPAEELAALAERAEDAVQQAETALARAETALDTAFNLLGLFEFVSGAIGILVPFLAIAAALIGFRRLESAQNELKDARESFEKDVQRKQAELDALRERLEQLSRQQQEELTRTTQQQRENSAKASLALSLLPLGDRQYQAQDYKGALDTYKRALALDPKNPIIHYRMGYVHTQSGELQEAETFMRRSLELDPGLTAAQAALGYVYRRMGDKMDPGVERDLVYNKAEQNLLAALQVSPKLMDEDQESWWGSLGGLYRRRGQVEQAITAYERATSVTPYSSYPFSNLALLYMQTQNRAGMLKTYRRVEQLAASEVQAEVNNYWAYADLITARLALGKYEHIDEVLEMGLEAAPADSPYTLESLIDTLTRLSDVLEAHEAAPVLDVVERIRAFKDAQQAAHRAAPGAD